jgi:hypothetical protein
MWLATKCKLRKGSWAPGAGKAKGCFGALFAVLEQCSSVPWIVSFMRVMGVHGTSQRPRSQSRARFLRHSARPLTALLPSSSACLLARRSVQWQRRESAHATSSRSASCLSVLAVYSLRRTIIDQQHRRYHRPPLTTTSPTHLTTISLADCRCST